MHLTMMMKMMVQMKVTTMMKMTMMMALMIMWGEAAPSLTSGYCDTTSCSECRLSWYDSDPNAKEYRCKDDTVYKYANKCGKKLLKKEGMNLCMTGDDQFCHMSFLANDKKKNKSESAACRSIPQDYIEGDW